jgi:DNA transformation protein
VKSGQTELYEVRSMVGSSEFVEFIVEMLQRFGSVVAKPMFGGCGLYLDGVMFALISNDTLYFKADEVSKYEFLSIGMAPFSYSKNDTLCKMSYFSAPDEALDDDEIMCLWAQKAYDAALRVHKEKKRATQSAA